MTDKSTLNSLRDQKEKYLNLEVNVESIVNHHSPLNLATETYKGFITVWIIYVQ